MSKNMKFLRNAALVVAVLAMVFGQCFGMLGGVAARAAIGGDVPAGLAITGITWKTAPASQALTGKEVSGTVSVTFKATQTIAEKKSVPVGQLIAVYGASALASNLEQTSFVPALAGDVEIPAMVVGQTVTLDIPVKATAGSASDTAGLAVVAMLKTDGTDADLSTALNEKPYNQIPRDIAASNWAAVAIKASADRPGTDSTATAADAIKVSLYNPTTGKAVSGNTLTAKWGSNLAGIEILGVTAAGKIATNATNAITLDNGNTGAKNISLGSLTSGVLDLTTLVNGDLKDTNGKAAFQIGVNAITLRSGNLSANLVLRVDPAVPTVALVGNMEDTNGNGSYGTNFGDDLTKDMKRVKLTATVTATNAYTFAYDATTPGVNKPEGYVVFKDNGNVIGQVAVGATVDNVPAVSGYTKVTDDTAGQATFVYLATKGAHKYTAEFVPAGEAAKVCTGSAASNALSAKFEAPVANKVSLKMSSNSIVAGQPVQFTLSFDQAAPGAGVATVKITDGTNVVNTAYFILNGTDKTYTTTVYFPVGGTYYINTSAAAGQIAIKLDKAGKLTGESGTPVDFVAGVEQTNFKPIYTTEQSAATIIVAGAATTTTLVADKTSVKVGDSINLTANVVAGAAAMNAGTVEFYEVTDKVENAVKVGEATINPLTKTATFQYTANNAAVNGLFAKYVSSDPIKYTDSKSAVVAITVENVKGSLKLDAPADAVAATGKAKITLSILDSTGKLDTTSNFGQVSKVLVDVDDYTPASTVYIYGGQAILEIDVSKLDAGMHEITVTVNDANYGKLTASGKFIVAAPTNLTATTLQITENDPTNTRTVDFGDNLFATDLTVNVQDAYGTGTYAGATGKVELYIGETKIATADVTAGIATFDATKVKALMAGSEMTLTAKYTGDKVYAASEKAGVKKYTVNAMDTVLSVSADANKLTILVNVPTGYTPNGKLVITSGDITIATISEVKKSNVIEISSPALKGEQDVTVSFTGDNGMKDASKTLKVTFPASSGWVESAAGVWNYYKDGEMVKGEWLKAGSWFYMNDQGVMLKGWQKLQWNGKSEWFYFKPASPNSGAMLTGWQQIGGKWYFMNGSGIMQTGWIKVGAYWYYMNTSGAMLTGWQQIGGNWYYLDANGRMATSGTIDGWNIAPNGIATKA